MKFVKVPREIDTKLDQIDSVATLPHIATEILEVMRSQNTSMRKIAAVIEKDPSITVKILKIANSPLWGAVGKVESVQRALVLLGLKQVSNIVIAISLYSTFAQLKPNPYFNRDQFWRHSIATAQIARKLCATLSINFNGEEFVTGLIHDLGKIVMDQFFGDRFKAIVEDAKRNGGSYVEIEKKHMDCTHADIGAALLERWNFPASIVMSIQYHHKPDQAPDYREMVSMINLANHLAKFWESPDNNGSVPNFQRLPSWQNLTKAYSNFANFNLEEFLTELNSEMDRNASIGKLISI